MKTIKNILLIQLFAFGLMLTGCYNDFNDPEPYKTYTDADFAGDRIVSIKELKDIYNNKFGANTIGKGVEITENFVIKGKVISTDAYGNVYRTMYIQDESGAIEIKIGQTGTYNEYKVGQIIYVKAKGLVLGSYRYMLSLGMPSVDPDYANGYIDVKEIISQTIFRGAIVGMSAADTTVVNSPTELNDNLLGRLIRFNGLTSFYGTWDNTKYPSFLEQIDDIYTDYAFVEVINAWKAYEASPSTVSKPKSPRPARLDYPTFAFNNDNNRYYGTALFKFGAGLEADKNQNLLLRSSGYSRFSLDPLPANGQKVDITAIYTKYSSRTGSYIKYQLLLNNVTDIVKK